MDYSLPASSVHGDSPGKNTGVTMPSSGDLPNQRTEVSFTADNYLASESILIKYIQTSQKKKMDGVHKQLRAKVYISGQINKSHHWLLAI